MYQKITNTDPTAVPSLLLNSYSQNQDIPPDQLSQDQNSLQNPTAKSYILSHKKAGLFLSVTILMKTIIGVGILSMPYIFSIMGIIPTIVSFLAAGILTQYSCSLLLKAKNLSGHSNFSSIMHHLHNHKGYKFLVSLILFGGNFGACTLDLMFFKKTVRKLIIDFTNQQIANQFYTSQYMILLIIAVIQFPIIILKKIQRLRFFSFIGVSGIIAFILAFLINYILQVNDGTVQITLDLFPQNWLKALGTIPTIIFSLAFQSNFFPIFKGLERSSDKRMLQVVMAGLLSCTICYLVIGFLGYSITKNVSGNFLQSVKYGESNIIIFIIMNGGFLLSLFFAFPIIFFSCKNNFILMVKLLIQNQQIKKFKWQQESNGQLSHQDTTDEKNNKILYFVYTTIIYLIIISIAMFVTNIQSVFNLTGGISCSSVNFLFPLFFYIQLIYKKNIQKKPIYYLSFALFIVMTIFSIFTIVAFYL